MGLISLKNKLFLEDNLNDIIVSIKINRATGPFNKTPKESETHIIVGKMYLSLKRVDFFNIIRFKQYCCMHIIANSIPVLAM